MSQHRVPFDDSPPLSVARHSVARHSVARRGTPLLAALLAGGLLLGPAARSQTAATAFEGSADVVQVQVPVNVLDRDGQPIAGLTAADFEIDDEGKKRQIVGFEVIDLAHLDEEEAARRRQELPAVARRNFLLFFDFSFSTAASIVKARQAAFDFVLNALHPSDLVAIATYSHESGVRLVMTFTPDRAQLARAIDTLGLARREGVAHGPQDPLRFLVEPPRATVAFRGDGSDAPSETRAQIESANLETSRAIGIQIERSQLAFERSRVTAWSRTLGDVARALNGVAGRKHVVYFSEGFDSELLLGRRPETLSPEADQRMQDRVTGQYWLIHGDQTHGDTFLQGDLADMLEEFRRADCVIQAVDIAGLRGEGGGDAVHLRSKGVDGLFYMARETGGELFEASNDLAAQLGRVLKRSELTYVLTFQPEDLEPDGAYHRLKVKVNGVKGARISHRAGYYAPRPFADLHPLEKSLLASDAIASAEPRQDVAIDVLAAPFRASETTAYVPVIVEVAGASLLAGQTGDMLPVEIYGYVTSEKGEMRDYFSQLATLDLRSAGPKLREVGLKYWGALELGPGRYLLRVLVRNAETGHTGVVAQPLVIPTWASAEPILLPPFFMDEPADRWLLLRHREDEEGGSVVYPFIVKGVPFVPAARPALHADQPVDLCLMTYQLGRDEPTLEARVVPTGGDASAAGEGAAGGGTPVELGPVERTVTGIAGFDKLLARFRPQGLKPGDYRLEVVLTDRASGARTQGAVPFTVRE